jgi:FKBP-type peptidyl-prolyl cis-trans isomerase SlpA
LTSLALPPVIFFSLPGFFAMPPIVTDQSLVTLHYRIALPEGPVMMSTFEATPATLQLGKGEMLPALEKCLIGLCVGDNRSFELACKDAFGPHRPELVENVALRHLPSDATEPMSFMEFTAPDGSRYAGLLREIGETHAKVDFNHPLAGRDIHFEVLIVGVS